MLPFHVSLLIHFVGVGMIFTTIFAGWILNNQYKRAGEWSAKAQYLKSLRAVGLLSPLGVLVLLLSGIGNMTLGPLQYTLFSDSWLSMKLVFFLLLAAAGVFFGIKSSRRTRLVIKIAEDPSPAAVEEKIHALDEQQRWFSIIQTVLLLMILILSIVKPLG